MEHARQRVLRCEREAAADPDDRRRPLHEDVARDLERAVRIRMLDRLERHEGLAPSLIRPRLVVRPVQTAPPGRRPLFVHTRVDGGKQRVVEVDTSNKFEEHP